jgi:glycosyltransferase involved in cell wall biosynthesis
MKVYIHGRDAHGSSIDYDRRHVEQFLGKIGHTITHNILRAEVVHSVWWNQLLTRGYYLLRFKRRIIATATNTIDPDNKDYLKARKWVNLWIAPSKRQLEALKNDGVRAVYQPFYVDEKIFRKLGKTREEIALALGIDFELIRDKFLIGSFQRDTLGADLRSPKWQKNPELLLEILSLLSDKDKWLLVIAGPRRHFILRECEKRRIPYYFYGQNPLDGADDLSINTIGADKVALLYNLIDCYLVTSKSEGGPKAVLEASFSKIPIFSTRVGLAPDILDKRCIHTDVHEIVGLLSQLIRRENQDYFNELTANNFDNAYAICSYEVTKDRWKQIYESLQDPHTLSI